MLGILWVAWFGCGSPPPAAHEAPAGHHAPGGHLEHKFDDAAKWAAVFDDPARDAWQKPDEVVAALAVRPGDKIADIGAGTGYFAVRLAAKLPQGKLYAVDVEPAMVAHLTERAAKDGLPQLVAVQAQAGDPSLPEPVDGVLVVDTYHHLPDRTAYFTKVAASLRPGGWVAIVDFRKDAPEGPPPEARLTPEQVDAELAAAGLKRTAQHDFLPNQYFLVYGAR